MAMGFSIRGASDSPHISAFWPICRRSVSGFPCGEKAETERGDKFTNSIGLLLFLSSLLCIARKGVAKTFFHVDGWDNETIKDRIQRHLLRSAEGEYVDHFDIIGQSGKVSEREFCLFSSIHLCDSFDEDLADRGWNCNCVSVCRSGAQLTSPHRESRKLSTYRLDIASA